MRASRAHPNEVLLLHGILEMGVSLSTLLACKPIFRQLTSERLENFSPESSGKLRGQCQRNRREPETFLLETASGPLDYDALSRLCPCRVFILALLHSRI